MHSSILWVERQEQVAVTGQLDPVSQRLGLGAWGGTPGLASLPLNSYPRPGSSFPLPCHLQELGPLPLPGSLKCRDAGYGALRSQAKAHELKGGQLSRSPGYSVEGRRPLSPGKKGAKVSWLISNVGH